MKRKTYYVLLKFTLVSLFLIFVFSCKEQTLNPVFDNKFDPQHELYKPDSPSLLKIELISESKAVVSWLYDYSSGGVNAFESGDLTFQLEIGDENKDNFVPVAFKSRPVSKYLSSEYQLLNAEITHNFQIDKNFSIRIKSIRGNKSSDYSATLYGKVVLISPLEIVVVKYNTINSNLTIYWIENPGDANNASHKTWNVLVGYKLYYREVRIPEVPYIELADVKRTIEGNCSYNGLNTSSLAKGKEYEFAILPYSENNQLPMLTKKWKYD